MTCKTKKIFHTLLCYSECYFDSTSYLISHFHVNHLIDSCHVGSSIHPYLSCGQGTEVARDIKE